MDNEVQLPNEAADRQIPVDPWETAFAALNKETAQNDSAASDAGINEDLPGDSGRGVPEGANGNPDANENDAVSNNGAADDLGGLDNLSGVGGESNDSGDLGDYTVTQDEIDSFRSAIQEEAEQQAINEVAQDFIKRGVRHTNGALGARIDDPDIMKRDSDGVPHFYNPDTKQEFTGDNPRRQAMEWVEDYNNDLARVFNNACQQRVNQIVDESSSQLQVMEFAPTYEKLDPIRQHMFDSLIEDYEIKNSSGEAIGYSIDLNKALAAVNRQVAKIQEYSHSLNPQPQAKQDQDKKGPALDMKSTTSKNDGSSSRPQFKSVEEALAYIQEQELSKGKK